MQKEKDIGRKGRKEGKKKAARVGHTRKMNGRKEDDME